MTCVGKGMGMHEEKGERRSPEEYCASSLSIQQLCFCHLVPISGGWEVSLLLFQLPLEGSSWKHLLLSSPWISWNVGPFQGAALSRNLPLLAWRKQIFCLSLGLESPAQVLMSPWLPGSPVVCPCAQPHCSPLQMAIPAFCLAAFTGPRGAEAESQAELFFQPNIHKVWPWASHLTFTHALGFSPGKQEAGIKLVVFSLYSSVSP